MVGCMRKTFKKSLFLYSKIFFSSILCLMISAFIALLFNFTYSKDIGYNARGYFEGDMEDTYLYTHFYEDGDDTKLAEYEEKGYKINKYIIHSNTPKSAIIYSGIISQAFSFIILIIMLRTVVWDIGFNVRDRKDLTKEERDKYWGFKIGLISMLPSYIFLIVLTIFKSNFTQNFRVGIFKILNSTLYGLIDIICSGTIYWGELKIYQILLLALSLLIIPVIAQVWFILGKKGILITEKLIYKK